MRIVKSIADFPANPSIATGFVPTLGALHEGHISLIQRSKQENDRTIVSIFVNPIQFGPNEDFNNYPRPIEQDCEMAASAGADVIFIPELDEMIAEHPVTIHVPYVSELFEGTVRPGHFDGVATIVAKLFNIVSPKNAYFGEKDLQQCAVIRKLTVDLAIQSHIVICETVREPSGLAKSSRNAYLNESESRFAPLIFQTLLEAKAEILEDNQVSKILKLSIEKLQANSFIVDYFELVDRTLMRPIVEPNDQASLIVAAKLGTTRLIDNIRVIG